MKRQDKYPDTTTFHFHNANPKNRFGEDCVIRAISTALEQSWEQTVLEMTELGIKYGYVLNDTHLFPKYLKSKGWQKCAQPRKDDKTKYTGKEFCRYLDIHSSIGWYSNNIISGNVIANIGGHHVVAFVPTPVTTSIKGYAYKLYDIWDSTGGCIGNYWVKKFTEAE